MVSIQSRILLKGPSLQYGFFRVYLKDRMITKLKIHPNDKSSDGYGAFVCHQPNFIEEL
jgi:hypothetical protein